MSTIIKCPINLKMACGQNKIGFSSANNVNVEREIELKDSSLFGIHIQNGTIKPNNIKEGLVESTQKLSLEVEITDNLTQEKCVEWVTKLETYLTILLTLDEYNPHHGINYTEVDWFDFDTHEGDTELRLRDACSITGTRQIKLHEQWGNGIEYNFLFRYYYDGVRAEYIKSKYLHWFLIIETIEQSDLYKRLFDAPLFDGTEMQALEQFANQFKKDTMKYSALMALQRRTAMSRKEKLFEILTNLGITRYKGTFQENQLSLETIGKIIETRNSLVHKGQNLDPSLVWDHLFPIARGIVRLLILRPNSLD